MTGAGGRLSGLGHRADVVRLRELIAEEHGPGCGGGRRGHAGAPEPLITGLAPARCNPLRIRKATCLPLPACPTRSAASEEVENGWMKISRQNDWGIDEEASWEDAAVAL